MEERAAVMVLLARDDEGLKVLLLRRKEDPNDRWSGQICLPGGRAKEGEDLIEAAIREVREETGIEVDRSSILLALEPVSPSSLPSLKVAPFVAELKGECEVKLGDEIEEAFWVPLSAMKEVDPKAYGLRGEVAYETERGIVWGLTAKIMRRVLGLLRIPS